MELLSNNNSIQHGNNNQNEIKRNTTSDSFIFSGLLDSLQQQWDGTTNFPILQDSWVLTLDSTIFWIHFVFLTEFGAGCLSGRLHHMVRSLCGVALWMIDRGVKMRSLALVLCFVIVIWSSLLGGKSLWWSNYFSSLSDTQALWV